MWVCVECTWENSEAASVCDGCETVRGTGLVGIAHAQQKLDLNDHTKVAAGEIALDDIDDLCLAQQRQQDAALWAASRWQSLQAELAELRLQEPSVQRARLRALQRELHPDKQCHERQQFSQKMFLLVQEEWEAHEVSSLQRAQQGKGSQHGFVSGQTRTESDNKDSFFEKTQREANLRMQKEKQDAKLAAEAELRRRMEELEKKSHDCSEMYKTAYPPDSGDAEGSEEYDTDSESAEEASELSDGASEIEDMFGDLRELLHSNCFSDMMQAFSTIQNYRNTTLGNERESSRLDRYEAEAWRQYARHQAEAGRYGYAIVHHLDKAIHLNPTRGQLHLERAQYAMQQYGLQLDETGLVSDMARIQAQQVLGDCEKALSCDSSLSAAYALAVRVLFAQGDLERAGDLAGKGARAAQNRKVASRLGKDRDFAQFLLTSLMKIELLSLAEDKRPEEVINLIKSVRRMASARVSVQLDKKLEVWHRQALAQQRFAQAATMRDELWESGWGSFLKS